MGQLDHLALRAAVLKLVADRVNKAFKEAKEELAALLGPEGRKNAVLEGNKIASVSVSKAGRATISNEAAFTAWALEQYPTEVEEVLRVRPAFAYQVLSSSQNAGQPCSPFGDLDVPGISVGEPYPLVRKSPGAEELVEKLWQEGRLTFDGELKELEVD